MVAYGRLKNNSAKSGRASLTRGFDYGDFTSKILVFWISGRTLLIFHPVLLKSNKIYLFGMWVLSLGECGRVHDNISN